MPSFFLDEQQIEFSQGESVLRAALRHGRDIPHYCYHAGFSVVATCRMCLVEITDMGNGRPMPKLQASCSTPAAEGMKVLSLSDKVRTAQNQVNEYLLVNHPLDCSICDQAGECTLQDVAYSYGSGLSEMNYEKRVYGWRDVGTYIMLERNRCIHCSRCERFSREVEGTSDFGMFLRSHELTFDTFEDHRIMHKFQGNLVDICPVGAITEREFRFKKRVWKLKKTESVCPSCSTGCNITIDHHRNHVERLKPRENQAVNRWWMCDEGRLGYRKLNARESRHLEPQARVKGKLEPAGWEAVYEAMANKIEEISAEGDAVLGIADTHATNEEMYLLKKLLADCFGGARAYFPFRPGTEPQTDRFLYTLITTDKSPNTQGAQAIGLLGDTDDTRLNSALAKGPKLVILLGMPCADDKQVREAVSRAELIVLIATEKSAWDDVADIILPGLIYAEKAGTFTNKHRRVQRIQPAIAAPEHCREQCRIFVELREAMGQPLPLANARAVFEEMGGSDGPFGGLTWAEVGTLGVPLNGEKTAPAGA